MKYFIAGVILALSSRAYAGLAVGTYVPGVARYQTDIAGSTNKFEFAPMVSLNHYYHLAGALYFAPELAFAWHLKTESEYVKQTAFFLYGFGWHVSPWWVVRFGAGTFYTRLSGSGSTVTRDNGSGTATFYAPGDTHTSYQMAASLGLEFYLNHSSSLRVETYAFDLPSSARRSFSYALACNFHF